MHSHAATPQASLVNALCQVGLRYHSSPYASIRSPLGLYHVGKSGASVAKHFLL